MQKEPHTNENASDCEEILQRMHQDLYNEMIRLEKSAPSAPDKIRPEYVLAWREFRKRIRAYQLTCRLLGRKPKSVYAGEHELEDAGDQS